MTTPRIGLAGIALESNRFAPVATEDDFRTILYLEGEEILRRARAPISDLAKEMSAFPSCKLYQVWLRLPALPIPEEYRTWSFRYFSFSFHSYK